MPPTNAAAVALDAVPERRLALAPDPAPDHLPADERQAAPHPARALRAALHDAAVLGPARGAEASLMPRAVLPPLWREMRTSARDLVGFVFSARPHQDAATLGCGAPVLLIPGLLAGDPAMNPLARFLHEQGHPVWPSGLRCNVDCSGRTVPRLIAALRRAADEHDRPVALVGHSRGGLLARVVAHRCPDLVSGVVTLGSPHRDQLAVHPVLWANLMLLAAAGTLGVRGVMQLGCRGREACCRGFDREAAAPLPADVPSVSVFSRSDGIVDWRACLDPAGENVEVDTSHLGMSSDRATLDAVAAAVARFAAA